MTTKKTTPVAPVHEIVHTPGPWKYHDSGSIVMTADGQMSVADIRGFGRLEKDFGLSAAIKIMDKNGQLIAAAPSLLDELRKAVEMLENTVDGDQPGFRSAHYEVARLRAFVDSVV